MTHNFTSAQLELLTILDNHYHLLSESDFGVLFECIETKVILTVQDLILAIHQ